MKVHIHPEVVTFFSDDAGPYNWDSLPQVIGLNAKTLENLEKGGLHKVETVFQLELAIGSWISRWTDHIAPYEIYVDPNELASVTAFRAFSGRRIYAMALSSSGLFKLINDSAKNRIKFFKSEVTKEDNEKFKKRELAFDNYLYNRTYNSMESELTGASDVSLKSAYASLDGFNTLYQFSIDEEAKPLTRSQEKYVRQLDGCISDLVHYARSAKMLRSDSLTAELDSDDGVAIRKRFVETVARLKRVNINVLAYERERLTRVFDCSHYEPPGPERTIHGPDSEYYLFTFHEKVVHIILAPTPYLRVPFPLEESVEWEPSEMWADKYVSDGKNLDYVGEELGLKIRQEPVGLDRDNVISLVEGPDAKPEGKD